MSAMNLDTRENPCGSYYETDHGREICNLEDGHKGPHESAWFEWPDGSTVRRQWTDSIRTSSDRCQEGK